MNNAISLVMLGGILAICILYLSRAFKATKTNKVEKSWFLSLLLGSLVGFLSGLLFGLPVIHHVFSKGWLLQGEKRDLGLWYLGTMGTTVLGGLIFLCVFSYLKNRKN